MTWMYQQSTGYLTYGGSLQAVGYSGCDDGRNNPEAQNIPNVGPIPVGKYTIGPEYNHPHLGPCTMNLDPTEDTNTFGRSAFRIHGNNISNDASHGCIIMPPAMRRQIANSEDKDLEVTT